MLTGLKTVGWQLAALALAVLLAAQTLRLNSALLASATAKTTLSAERATAERLARQQSEAHRETERKLREDHERIEGEAKAAIAAVAADADRARTAGQRLQRELADYLDTHRRAALARAAAGQCTPDPAPLDLLAHLQRRADDRAGELAHIADTARARGLACERAYDSARAMIDSAQ